MFTVPSVYVTQSRNPRHENCELQAKWYNINNNQINARVSNSKTNLKQVVYHYQAQNIIMTKLNSKLQGVSQNLVTAET